MTRALLALMTLAACASSTEEDPIVVGKIPAAFAKYCRGTLRVPKGVMRPSKSSGWVGNTRNVAPAGTEILLGINGPRFDGYAFDEHGAPLRLDTALNGINTDTEVTADCPYTASVARETQIYVFVTLSRATLYPSNALTGTACTLEPATELHDHSLAGGDTLTIQASELPAKCGFATAFSNDLVHGFLITR